MRARAASASDRAAANRGLCRANRAYTSASERALVSGIARRASDGEASAGVGERGGDWAFKVADAMLVSPDINTVISAAYPSHERVRNHDRELDISSGSPVGLA